MRPIGRSEGQAIISVTGNLPVLLSHAQGHKSDLTVIKIGNLDGVGLSNSLLAAYDIALQGVAQVWVDNVRSELIAKLPEQDLQGFAHLQKFRALDIQGLI